MVTFQAVIFLVGDREYGAMLKTVREREGSIRTDKFSAFQAVCKERYIALAFCTAAVEI